ncbi:MAG: hypothetical protein KHW55_06285, partial [Actinomyces sp.]|nr:hypothetical protein [Actinomyces sp.]
STSSQPIRIPTASQTVTFPNNLARNLTSSVFNHGSQPQEFNDTISNPEKHGRELRAKLWREHVAGSYP